MYLHQVSWADWRCNAVFVNHGAEAQHNNFTKNRIGLDLVVGDHGLWSDQNNVSLKFLNFQNVKINKTNRPFSRLTYLEQLDGLRVSCHHVDGANQGLSSLNDTDVIHVELLLDELQRHVSSNGRYSVQEPMPVKHKQTMFNISQ